MSAKTHAAPFSLDAIRPYVSVTLHHIFPDDSDRAARESPEKLSQAIAEELAAGLDSLFDVVDIQDKNPWKLSPHEDDRAPLAVRNDPSGLSLAGVWFKRNTTPPWLVPTQGPPNVRDVTNHVLLVAVRFPYLAVLGTFDRSRDQVATDLGQGLCGTRRLSFLAPAIDEKSLERAFIRGRARVCWLTALHAPIDTKPDSKTLLGRDLRHVLEPFGDQTFTFSSVVSVLPALEKEKVPSRRPRYTFPDAATNQDREQYAFRVGVAPEQHRVWTLHVKNFDHLLEELHVLFDTLALPPDSGLIGKWCHDQDGFKFLGKPVSASELAAVRHAFDAGLDLPPPVEPGSDIHVRSEAEKCRELWRVHGQLDVLEAGPSADFKIGVRYQGDLVLALVIEPRAAGEDAVELFVKHYETLDPYHEGATCFETLFEEDRAVPLTVRYDSGHVLRGTRLFRLGWQDVLFESWRWPFRSRRGKHKFSAALEKPPTITKEGDRGGARGTAGIPSKEKGLGWEKTLGTDLARPQLSLFEYVVLHAKELFAPAPGQDWYLCSDDGPGEIADFIDRKSTV